MSSLSDGLVDILAPDLRSTRTVPLESWQLFWAKTDRDARGTDAHDDTWTRPLWAHLLDVGHTALLLWECRVPATIKRQAAGALGMSEDEAGSWLSFWIGLHDLGKAIPSFQFQDPGAAYLRRMKADGFTLRPGPVTNPVHHGHATIGIVCRDLLRGDPDAPPAFRETLAAFIGFHHGRLLSLNEWRRLAASDARLGGSDWAHAQTQLLHAVHAAWDERYGLARLTAVVPPTPPWLLGLAGWATLADWLGSLAEAFPRETGTDPAAYLDASRAGAAEALRRAGVDATAALTVRPFADLFPHTAGHAPRPVQQALLDLPLPADPGAPTLTIVEAPTGEGKTEAALALAARQQARGGPAHSGPGLYLALPTQATANGLLARTTDFLERAHRAPEGSPTASFRLAYGRSELHPASEALLSDPDALAALDDEDGATARVRTLRWFTGRKRALLAPYGLGTVDQALLGVLFARHFFVRLFGLAGKTVIVDEVHAYDVYTGALVLRLLPWLRALGAHVVLLSATLPARARHDLLRAWDADAPLPPEPDPARTPYPAVWTSAEGNVRVLAGEADGLSASRTQRAGLERLDPALPDIAAEVARAVAAGAVVAVVCNTVRRAQQVFEALRERLALPPGDLVLFHARFVRRDRQAIEDAVVGHRDAASGAWAAGRFGKGRADGPAVLVGTQVVEQSLDLDVDLMLSDLAPVDLLLQRAGRLHRHDRTRPAAHVAPRLVWLCPAWEAGGLPDVTGLSGHGHVYDRTVLWRTALLLSGRAAWALPHDYRPLVEAVYGSCDAPAGLSADAAEQWTVAMTAETARREASMRAAGERLIPPPPCLHEVIDAATPPLAGDEDEAAHATLRAATREGESVEVVVLHERPDDGALFLDPALSMRAPLHLPAPKKALSADAVRALLGASVRLGQKRLVAHVAAAPDLPDAWRAAAETTPALVGLHPLVMRAGAWRAAGTTVTWSDALGLVLSSD